MWFSKANVLGAREVVSVERIMPMEESVHMYFYIRGKTACDGMHAMNGLVYDSTRWNSGRGLR